MARHDFTVWRRKGQKIWQFYYYDLNDERKSASSTKKNKIEAEEYAKAFVKALHDGPKEEPKVITLGDLIAPYYTDKCPRQKTLRQRNKPMGEEHKAAQRSRLERYIFPHPICQKDIKKLTRGDFRDLIDDLLNKHTVSAVNNAVKALKTAMEEEFISGNLPTNYLARMGNIAKEEKEAGIFTAKEGEILFYSDVSLGTIFKEQRERIANLIAYEAGLRRAEILCLTWKKIDWTKHIIHINEAWKNFNKKRKGLPKWNKIRDVPMSERLEKELRLYYEDVLFCGDDDFVICWDDRMPVSPRTWQRWFETLCSNFDSYLKKKTENEEKKESFDRVKRNIKPHGFRHTRISLWKMAGVPEELVQLWAGHSEKKTTKGYTHYSNEFMVEQLRKYS